MARRDKVTPKLSDQKLEAVAKTGELSKEAGSTDVQAQAEAPSTEADNDENNAAAAKKNVVDRSKHHYQTHKDAKTAGGRASVDNDDPLAKALRGKDAEAVIKLVQANGGDVGNGWPERNPGLRRMAAGNMLRKLARRSEGVTIDGHVVKLEPLPETEAKAA